MKIDHLAVLPQAQSRSISPENLDGAKGKGGMATTGTGLHCAEGLGQGWKINPFVHVEAGQTVELAGIDGPGAIEQIWMTPTGVWRWCILRIYWDDQEHPSVECPVGDFFACGWGKFCQVSSMAVCVNPGSAFNCYWDMPFHKKCRITFENLGDEGMNLYYQINYRLGAVPEKCAYFHAQFRRVNTLPYKQDYVILDGVRGHGQYVGTYMARGVNNNGWWGEGEIKFFLDGDDEFPTICGTGTEDYFAGSYNFENQETKQYQEYTTPYAGLPQVIRPDGLYQSQMRFGMYRWHITDPVRFHEDIKVTMQAIGWRKGWKYLPLQDDMASVAYWYQSLPSQPFPALPDKDALEII